MTTEYVVRSITPVSLLRTRYTVVDMSGRVHHVTITDEHLRHGDAHHLIMHALNRAPKRKPTDPR